jgi:hypothetical protein
MPLQRLPSGYKMVQTIVLFFEADMTLNFQEVSSMVKELGEAAPTRQQELIRQRVEALQTLRNNSGELERLRYKVSRLVETIDPNLRCALPVTENLDAAVSLPELTVPMWVLAADGSQIALDRHAAVEYCLVNVGAIRMHMLPSDQPFPSGAPVPTLVQIESQLLHDDDLYTATGMITEARLALMRDLRERSMLARLAKDVPAPAITITDGPMELWGSNEAENRGDFKESLKDYLGALSVLYELGAITAGYVDKPSANLTIRLLEVALLPEDELGQVKHWRPLRRVTDIDLFKNLLEPGQRSAVFALQSHTAQEYAGVLALHFFYLNVGLPGRPSLARVEVPAWVVNGAGQLDMLQAALVAQCRSMGKRPFPYVLHRAHEAALVTLEEKEQVTNMIALELRRRGVEVGEISNKQAAKNSGGRTSYPRGGLR